MSDRNGPGFVHLHVHAAFSLLEGALSIATLAKLAQADSMPAVALTDTNNLFGALEFSEKMAGLGIQPIAGVQISLEMEERETGRAPPRGDGPGSVVLLARDEEGVANLIELASAAWLDPPSGQGPLLTLPRLAERRAGLILLTGGGGGPLDRAIAEGREDVAAARLARLADLFGDRLYVELHRHGLPAQRQIEPALLDLAYRTGLPLVATNDAYFAKAADYESHDALICIAGGRTIAEDDRRRLTPEHGFKTRAEMGALFADLPEALDNSVEIARRCHARILTRRAILPRFATAAAGGDDAEAAELRRQAEAGLAARLAAQGPAPGIARAVYEERLAFELSVIAGMNYPGYFLIVADFIQWAKANRIPVGPGRGSGAGSLVAWALTITDIDPLRFGLLFERFLNPERVSMPDFDIDFCQDRRDEVIRYVRGRYGADRVAQIITFGTLLARGVMRDVGRVLQMPYGQVDRLTKLVPQNPAQPISLAKAIETEPRLAEAAAEEPIVARMLAIAQKLEGLYRHASTHAAGIVIGDRPLSQLVPLYRDPKSDMPVTQYNMKWVEQAGLVKFDFLGLKTLTVLEKAVGLLAARGVVVDLAAIPLDDAKTYAMLGRGETVGVFQVESGGMRKALVDMKADRFEDLIALVALYRPGPMANIPVYCQRKLGRERAEYIHPQLEPVLRETFGIIVYQEQVMQAAQVLSGYSLGEADLLRRAMGKKIKKEMDDQRERFVTGAVGRGVALAKANEVFDLLAKFADYGFNKSHAAAYALVAYQTAWMKANHPVEFLAASMTLDMSNTDKLAEFRQEAQRLGVRVEPPSIARSGVEFDVRDGAIHYALAAVKGVGRQAVEAIVAARRDGPFASLADFAARIASRAIGKRPLEALVNAGAFDVVEPDRARAAESIDHVIAISSRTQAAAAAGQEELFGAGARAETLGAGDVAPWTPAERLQREYAAVGFFLSGHPLDDFAAAMKRLSVRRYVDFAREVRAGASMARLAATVLDRSEKRTRTGGKLGVLLLSDQSAQYEAVIFSEQLAECRDLLEPGRCVLLTMHGAADGDDIRARVQQVQPLESVAAGGPVAMKVFVRDPETVAVVADRLPEAGEDTVSIVAMLDSGRREVEIRLPQKVRATPRAVSALRSMRGVVAVELG